MQVKNCLLCGALLTGKKQKYCNEAHRKKFERWQEKSLPQPETTPKPDTKPDKLSVPGVNTSGLASAFPYEDLRDFAQHILGLAEYEHTWAIRMTTEMERLPPPKRFNEPLSPDYRRLNFIRERYQKSEQMLRWIADQVIEAIGHDVKPHPSPTPAPEWSEIDKIRSKSNGQ